MHLGIDITLALFKRTKTIYDFSTLLMSEWNAFFVILFKTVTVYHWAIQVRAVPNGMGYWD